MITRVVLENWRSHELTELDFAKGTNVLVGVMGSGKSSVMDGICYALFGTFPTLQSRRLKLDDVIMNKPQKKDKARVSVTFRNGEKEYTATREITRGHGSSAEVRDGGTLVEGNNSQRVTERIEEMLKIDYDLFSRAVYSEQNNIDYFLEIPKSQRKQKIDELLSIDRFEAARKSLTTVVSRLRDRAAEKEKIAAPADAEQIPILEKEISGLEGQKAESKSSLASIIASKSRLESEHSAISSNKKRHEEASRSLESSRGRLTALKERLAGYGLVQEAEEAVRARIESLKKEKAEIRSQADGLARMEMEQAALLSSVKSAEERLADLRSRKLDEEAPARRSQLIARMDALTSEIEAAHADKKAKAAALAELDENSQKLAGDACPVCDAPLTEEKKAEISRRRVEERSRLAKEMEASDARAVEKNSERNSLKPFLQQAENAVAEYQALKAMLADAAKHEAELVKKKSEAAALSEKIAVLKSAGRDPDAVEKSLREAERMVEYFASKKDTERCVEDVARFENALASVKYDPAAEKNTYDALKDAEKSLLLAEQSIAHAESLLAEKGKRLAELVRLANAAEQNRAEHGRMLKAIDSLGILASVLESAQAQLRSEFTDTVNAALTDSWLKIYPYRDYSDLKLDVDESGDYTLKLRRRDGDWVGVEGITSGGERSCACLALRIALSLVLTQNLSWLVLDEPTHNIDRQGIRELSKTLREHLPRIVEQIFIITHEEELESAASGYLYRFERKKEEDEPTRAILESSAL